MSIHKFSYTSISGEPVNLSEYDGKVILIVNVASKCGFTPQYKALEELYKKYKEQGFEIIGFPCDQFGGQEPGTEEEIVNFCSLNYGVTFPLSAKVEVREEGAIPLYQYLTAQKPFQGFFEGEKAQFMETFLKEKYQDGYTDSQIKWNFTKFLIDKNGEVVARYEPTVEPESIAAEIEKLL
ncbi:glutathione peroxidase [Clostridia bacterium]|nr:glutathione peroxidase [Clostridia bacterium]